jgi:transcriptional regulator with XRE-family HTH domain
MQKTIERLIKKHGGLRPLSRAIGISPSYLQRMRIGEKNDPSPEVLDKLGLERVVSYRRKRK